MTCYTCGKRSTNTVCDDCVKHLGLKPNVDENEFAGDEEPTNPQFDLSDFNDADFAADEDGAVINTERWTLLEALYDECRLIRENLAQVKGGYFIAEKELIDLFVILDTLETL